MTGSLPIGFSILASCDLGGNDICGMSSYRKGALPCGTLSVCAVDVSGSVVLPTSTTIMQATPTSANTSEQTQDTAGPIGGSVVGIVVLAAICIGGYLWWKRRGGRASVVMSGFTMQKASSMANLVAVHSL